MSEFLSASVNTLPPNLTWQETFGHLLNLATRFSRHAVAKHAEEILKTYPGILEITIRPKHIKVTTKIGDLFVHGLSEDSGIDRAVRYAKKGVLSVDEGEAFAKHIKAIGRYTSAARLDTTSKLYEALSNRSRSMRKPEDGDYLYDEELWKKGELSILDNLTFPGRGGQGARESSAEKSAKVVLCENRSHAMSQTLSSALVIGSKESSLLPREIFWNLKKAAALFLVEDMAEQVKLLKSAPPCNVDEIRVAADVGEVKVAACFSKSIAAGRIENTSRLAFWITNKQGDQTREFRWMKDKDNRLVFWIPRHNDEKYGSPSTIMEYFYGSSKTWLAALRLVGEAGGHVVESAIAVPKLSSQQINEHFRLTMPEGDRVFARQIISTVDKYLLKNATENERAKPKDSKSATKVEKQAMVKPRAMRSMRHAQKI